jgi:hypothetical protein
LDKAKLQREQHNLEIARQRALRETAATDLALAKAEAQKAKLAAQQAASVGQQMGAAPTFKDPTEQKLFELSQAQQAGKTQSSQMGELNGQPSTTAEPEKIISTSTETTRMRRRRIRRQVKRNDFVNQI